MSFDAGVFWSFVLAVVGGVSLGLIHFNSPLPGRLPSAQEAASVGAVGFAAVLLIGIVIAGWSPLPGSRHLDPVSDNGAAACRRGDPRSSNPYNGKGDDLTTVMFRNAWRAGWDRQCRPEGLSR